MNLEDKLNLLGTEFREVLISEKEVRFKEVYNSITKIFYIDKELENLNDKDKKIMIDLLRAFYDYGFLIGVDFILDPDNLNEETIENVYGK